MYKYTYQLYQKVLSDFKPLLKLLNISDLIDVTTLFYLLKQKNQLLYKKRTLKDLKKYKEVLNTEMYDLLGCRVFTGCGLCRHNTAFCLDLSKQLDLQGVNLLCHGTDIDHVVMGTIINNQKIILDPTNNDYGFLKGNQIILTENKTPYTLFNPNDEIDNFLIKRFDPHGFYQEFLNIECKELSIDMEEKREIVKSNYYQNAKYINDFRKEHQGTYKKLAYNQYTISGYK